MAKVVYTKSPVLHERETFSDLSGQKIRDVLDQLGLLDASISVAINDDVPEKIDLDYILEEGDLVEIRRVVSGGGAQGKQNLATFVQLAALIAVTALTMGATAKIAIMVGASLISGALNREAARLMSAGATPDIAEQDIAANKYSDVTSTNEIKPLAPVPLVMGRHRVTPELHAPPISKPGSTGYASEAHSSSLSIRFMPSQNSNSAPDSSVQRWINIPAGALGSGFPIHPIKVAPYNFYFGNGNISSAEETAIINQLNQIKVNGNFPYADFSRYFVSPFAQPAFPIVVYHSYINDWAYGRFSFLNLLSMVHASGMTYITALNSLFTGNVNLLPGGSSNAPLVVGESHSWLRTQISNSVFLPSTITSSDTPTQVWQKLGAELLQLNNGAYTTGAKTNGNLYTAERLVPVARIYNIGNDGAAIPNADHIFNFGIGELEISDRKIGGIGVELGNQNTLVDSGAFSIWKPGSGDASWRIPWAINGQVQSTGSTYTRFPVHVTNKDPVKLRNTTGQYQIYDPAQSTEDPYSQNDDESTRAGYSLFMGDYGQNACRFTVYGFLYGSGTNGLTTNSTGIDIQYKKESSPTWTPYTPSSGWADIINIQNNNTKPIALQWTLLVNEFGFDENDRLKIRFRKVTPDSIDNAGMNVSDLTVRSVHFYQDIRYSVLNDELQRNAPMNLEGLSIDARISETATTQHYSALVESHCWVYNFQSEEWEWAKTKNPAWWFLYYARGGFLNLDAIGEDDWPLSPTKGWINYPVAEGNTDRIFGAGLLNDEIDMDKIKEWAQFCDDKSLEFSLVLKDDTSSADVLEKIANAGRASVTYYNGLLSVVWEDGDQSPVGLYGMANMLAGSFRVNYAVGETPRKIVASFVNEDNWTQDTVEAVVPFSDPSSTDIVEVFLEGITSKTQAQREVNIAAARQFYQKRTYSWQTDAEGYYAKRGDLVYLSHDSTQYGFSGRVIRFLENGIVVGARLDDSITHITLRYPNGDLETLECTVDGQEITFSDPFPANKKPWHEETGLINNASLFKDSMPEDFVFIAGEMQTPGKIVRISEVQSDDSGVFSFTAFDEDPAMWAYEYDTNDPGTGVSFEDSKIVLEVVSAEAERLDDSRVRISWNIDTGDFVQLIDVATSLPLESGGKYSFSGSSVVVDFIGSGEVDVIPLAIGTPFKSVSKRVSFDWHYNR